MTADFTYVRLHGPRIMYASGYTDQDLDEWAAKITRWRGTGKRKRDAYVYFDNDVKTYAPRDALGLMKLLGLESSY